MKIFPILVLVLSSGLVTPAFGMEATRDAALCGGSAQASTPRSFASKPAAGTKAICPVMQHEFTVKADTQFSQYKGRWYAFCCPGCKPKFDKDPSQYAGR